jgi:hypothetical protein
MVYVHCPDRGHTHRDQGSCTFQVKEMYVRIDKARHDPAASKVNNNGIGSEQEFDGPQAEIGFVSEAISVHSGVCKTAN